MNIPRYDSPVSSMTYATPGINPRVTNGLGRSYAVYAIAEAKTHPGFPQLISSVNTYDLELLHTNLHPIYPWRPGYLSSNVVVDLAQKIPSTTGG